MIRSLAVGAREEVVAGLGSAKFKVRRRARGGHAGAMTSGVTLAVGVVLLLGVYEQFFAELAGLATMGAGGVSTD